MTDQIIIRKFDYAALDDATSAFVRTETAAIHGLIKNTARNAFDIGKHLQVVKDRLGHGQFGDWLAAEFPWSERTAQNLMALAAKSAKFADLETVSLSALYQLAAPSMPDDVVELLVERAEAGERITPADIKAATDQLHPRPAPASPDRVLAAEQWLLDELRSGPHHVNLLERGTAEMGFTPAEFAQALQNLKTSKEITQSGHTYSLAQTRTGSDAELVLQAIRGGAHNYTDLIRATGITGTQRITLATSYLEAQGRIKRVKEIGFVAVDEAEALPAPVPDVQPGESGQPTVEPDAAPAPTPLIAELNAHFDHDAITLLGDSDQGAWHRAIEVARRLVAAGHWDGQCQIEFDAVQLHNRLFGVEHLDPAALVAGQDFHVIDRPTSASMPAPAAPSPASMGPLYSEEIVRDMIVGALRDWDRPLGHGELRKYAHIPTDAYRLYETALQTLLDKGVVAMRRDEAGRRRYHTPELFARLEARDATPLDDALQAIIDGVTQLLDGARQVLATHALDDSHGPMTQALLDDALSAYRQIMAATVADGEVVRLPAHLASLSAQLDEQLAPSA